MENYNKLKELLDSTKDDAEKFYDKKNSSAGTRLRKTLQEMRKSCREIRFEIAAIKKAERENKKK